MEKDLQDIQSHTPVGELPSVQGARHLRARTGGEGLAGHPVTHTCWRTAISTGRASLESEDRWRRTCRTSSHTHLLENCHQYRRASLESEDRWRGLAGHLVTHTCWRTAISTGRASLESEDRWRRTCRTPHWRTVTHTCWRTAISTGRASLESEDRWRRTCRTSSHTHLALKL